MYKITSLIGTLLVVSSSGCLFNPFSLFSEDMPGKEAIIQLLSAEEQAEVEFEGNAIYDFNLGLQEFRDGSRKDFGVATVECHLMRFPKTRPKELISRCSMYYRIGGEVVWPSNTNLKSMYHESMHMEVLRTFGLLARPRIATRCKYKRLDVGSPAVNNERHLLKVAYEDVITSECKERP